MVSKIDIIVQSLTLFPISVAILKYFYHCDHTPKRIFVKVLKQQILMVADSARELQPLRFNNWDIARVVSAVLLADGSKFYFFANNSKMAGRRKLKFSPNKGIHQS